MWLKFLLIELSEIKMEDFIEPSGDIGPADREVGQMTEDQKKIFTLVQKNERAAAEYLINGRYAQNDNVRNEALKKASELKQKSDTLREIMWISIKDEFGLWAESIGVRKGFKVVTTSPSSPNFLDFLRNI